MSLRPVPLRPDREALTAAGFRAAWRVARAVPEPVAHAVVEAAADVLVRRGGPRVDQLRRTLSRVRPEASAVQLDDLVRAGFRSYARYWCDVFRLPAWTTARTVGRMRFSGGERLRDAVAAGDGVVGFLGHLGNWDHAAAWGAHVFPDLVTVAERLRPEAVFDEFVAFRRSLGIDVLPLGDPATFPALVRRVRAGAFAPLLADRDLASTGVEVDFLGERVRMARGPAALALLTGAPLFPLTLHHERGYQVLTVHPAVPVPPRPAGTTAREHRERAVATMTQACADVLAEAVRAHPAEWHVLQPFFPGDLRSDVPDDLPAGPR